jgi:hypothetical protein
MAQQILNPNSLAPNDKLGDTPNAYTAKINDNFTELYAVATLTRRVVVNTIADLPAAVGGVITTAANTLYVQADDVAFSTSRLVIGANSVYSGLDSLVVTASYTGTLPFFTFTNTSGSVKNLNIVHPNSPLFSFSDPTGSHVLRVSDVSYAGSSIGTLGGNNSGIRLTNFSGSVTANGMLFTGNWLVFLFEPSLSSLGAGLFIDLGSATFDSISISETTLSYVTGSFFMSGLANAGNINAGGLASIESVRLTGTGTPLQGITPDDILYVFAHNNSIRDSRPDGLISMQGNTVQTVVGTPVGGTGTPVLAAGVWVLDELSQFTAATSGRFTYIGDNDVRLPIIFSVSVSPALSTGISISAYIAINGVAVAQSRRQGTGAANNPTSITLPWQYTFSTGDYIEVFVANDTNATNILVSSAVGRIN